jgi:hypothetical protein
LTIFEETNVEIFSALPKQVATFYDHQNIFLSNMKLLLSCHLPATVRRILLLTGGARRARRPQDKGKRRSPEGAKKMNISEKLIKYTDNN